MLPISKHSFEGGINGDISQRLIPSNQVLNCMNSRVGVSELGRDFRLENILGTTSISQSVFPPYGTNQCIGSAVDYARDRILFAICNTSDDHGIYCLDNSNPATPVVYAVLYDSQVTGGLGFSKTSRIDRNMKVIGDLLYWTDNNNEPRRINIEAGIKMNHAGYVTSVPRYEWPMNQSVIRLIRRPPAYSPSAAKSGSNTANFIYNFAGKFAFRYRYRDGEYSVFGPPSAMINYNTFPVTDNSEYITVGWAATTGEHIDQDVQVVELAVSYGNDPNYFVFKKWDKDNAADLAVINAFNTDTGALQFDFYNDILGEAVSNADSVKPFDPIPTRVKTLEIALNRLFLANYISGYDTPSTSSLTPSLSNAAFGQGMKRYSSYQIGIRFRDQSKRQSFIYTNDSMVISTPDRTFADTLSTNNVISWALSNANAANEIPDWAYYYDIVVTKNLRTRFFMQARCSDMKYAIKAADGTISYQNSYVSTAYGVAIELRDLVSYGMGYDYNEGDIARIYFGSPPVGYPSVYSQAVLAVDGNYVIVQAVDMGPFAVPTALFEIYTPYKRSTSEIFYTIGQSYLVTNPTASNRTYATLSGTIPGDQYSAVRVGAWCERMSPNDNFWRDYNLPFGETNIASSLGQETKTNFIRWSNTTVPGTLTNGLSTFDALDEKSLPNSMGAIAKLQVASKVAEEGNIMLSIGEKQAASLYLGEVQLVGASSNAFVASSPGVIGTVNVLKGNYGTINPESVIEFRGIVFWVDALNGCVVQYSNNGLDDVSKFGMGRFFGRYLKNYLEASANNLDNINGFHHIPTAIDPFTKELIITLPALIYSNYATTLPSYSAVPSYATSIINRFDVYDSLGKSMSYSFEKNRWGSNYEYMAEQYDYLQNSMFAWKNGAIWLHNDDSTNYNNFYGTQYPVRVCFACNVNPSALKELNNISVESNLAPDFTVAYADYPNVQITDLRDTDYVDRQGFFYKEFFKDRLSPNSTGATADEKLYASGGDSLTDIALKVMVEVQAYDSLFFCNFVDIGFALSRGQKAIQNPINQ
jgi:hypothetical protein